MSALEHQRVTDPTGGLSTPARRMLAVGRVHLWQGGSLWIGHGRGRSDWHDHHALQIALALDGACMFRGAADGAWSEFTGAIVRSHRHHQFEVDGATMAQLFVEPETIEGRSLSERFTADITPLSQHEWSSMVQLLRGAYRSEAGAGTMIASARAAIALLAGPVARCDSVDVRVGRAIEHIRAHIHAPVTLAEAAAAAALSPGRFRHLFVQETGTGFRAYVLWMRLNVAIQFAMAGCSWTQAAHEAGFADSAHLTRTFRRMFGMNPAALVPH
jgi:AraC family transcriptional regulator